MCTEKKSWMAVRKRQKENFWEGGITEDREHDSKTASEWVQEIFGVSLNGRRCHRIEIFGGRS